ncbi:type IV pilus secretin PilQ [Hydrogenophaga defluvii]|uniref:Type IV pilus biogenesis and competence protein PilQ n=2 Tax=Hydrogenophaga defluvii TaxID=249410 RepID=A0ABW2S8E0_9BURK
MRSDDRSPTTARGTALGWARRLAAVLMAGAVAAVPAAWSQAQNSIRAITTTTEGGNDVVRVEFDKPLTELPKGFSIQSPARIALDFAGVGNGTGRTAVELNQGNVRSANVVEAGDRTRVVLNLAQASQYQAQISGNSVLVVLQGSAAAGGPRASSQATFAEARSEDVLPLKGIDFRRGAQGTGRVIVDLPNAQVGVDIRQQGKLLVVEFLKASLPDALRRRLDVTDFGTPVQTVTTTQNGDRVRLQVEPTGTWEHSAYQSDSQFVLEVREVKPDPNKLSQGPGFTGEKLSLNFQNIEVRALLQVIADFTNFNIVTSDTVTGSVTLRLQDVPWDQALDIILQAKGLGMKKNGNVLWIAPKDEIVAREKLDFEALNTVRTLEPLRTQSFQMSYVKAAEIAEQLRSGGGGGGGGGQGVAQQRMLSERGSVIVEPRTNQLFVTDIPSRLEQVQELLAKIDIPVRQVMIEARIVEADDNFSRSLGVRLGGSDLRGVRGGDAGYAVGGGNRVALGGSYNAVSSTTAEAANTLNTINTSFVNMPATGLGGVNPAALAVSLFSPAANRFLNLEISALQADGRGKIVSSPRVITADQIKAIIEQGTEFPYQVASASGATALQFRKAVLKLEVVPQITPEGGIILDVQVNKDSPGELLTGGQRAINTKRIQTQVLVENGGTVVIGGIYESNETESETKVPVLGDVPVLGNLFKSRNRVANKTELLIFLTPKVVTERGGVC